MLSFLFKMEHPQNLAAGAGPPARPVGQNNYQGGH